MFTNLDPPPSQTKVIVSFIFYQTTIIIQDIPSKKLLAYNKSVSIINSIEFNCQITTKY